MKERQHWDEYQDAFEQMLRHTSTKWAPWWVIPADHKWVTRALVAGVITDAIEELKLKFPPSRRCRSRRSPTRGGS